MPKNLHIIESSRRDDILAALRLLDVSGAHFTNGTFALSAKLIVPTTLAGFKHASQSHPDLPLVLAVNSDTSLQRIGKANFEPQLTRALKVAEPLAEAFPDNRIIVLFYDEETPNELYKALESNGHTLSLHKWGYGTEPSAPKIEGAAHFKRVYAYPLPNDQKPVCWADTPLTNEPQAIQVVDLRGKLIAEDGILFRLPNSLKHYQSSRGSEEKISLESGASLVDVVSLSKALCSQPIKAKLKYASEKNFVGRPINGYEKGVTDFALMTPRAAKQLCLVQNYLIENHGYGLLIYDAYRPKRAVHDFLFWSRQPVADAHERIRKEKHYPNIQKNQLFDLGYVAEDSGHCYGNTVDLVLIDLKNGNKLPMGTRYDFMDETSHYSANKNQIGETAHNNRTILRDAMQAFGFHPYEKEYWHFSHGGTEGRETQDPMDSEISRPLRGTSLR